jgi:CHAD domain-containing protein
MIDVLFPKQPPRLARKIKKLMRRARRACGEWRSCEVLSDLVAQRQQAAQNALERRAWELVRSAAEKRRERETRRARKKLRKLDLPGLAETVKSKGGLSLESATDVRVFLPLAISAVYQRWQSALALASEDRSVENIHGFRIRTKRLRYCIELADVFDRSGTTRSLKWLKSLQEVLGHWHDRVELVNICAKALADPRLIADEPDVAALLLSEIDKAQQKNKSEVAELLHTANQAEERNPLESWISELARRSEPPAPIPSLEPAFTARESA